MIKKIILIVLLLLIPVASADEIDVGADMIEEGIRQTGIGFADDIYSLGVNGTGDSGTIIMMASYTLDPYSIPAVNDMNRVVTDLFFCLFIMIIFGHATILLLSRYRPEKIASLEFVTVDFNGYQYSEYVQKMLKGIFILALAHFSIGLILDLCYVITSSLMQSVPGSLAPTSSNVILYGMMALIWLSEMIFFIIRTFVIVIFAAFALLVGALYLWGPTEHLAIGCFKYFLALVFMQPIIVGITCVGVRAIKESSGLLGDGGLNEFLVGGTEIVYYLGLMVILFVISLVIVLGPLLQLIFRVVLRRVI